MPYSNQEGRYPKRPTSGNIPRDLQGYASIEALAEVVAARVLRGSGSRYTMGWITPASSDGGSDFIGRLSVGSDFSSAQLIVLGQAKCEITSAPTGGRHIARTVARLRRGWLGVYVTTSYFSLAVQREVLEDAYPIVLINGLRVAREVIAAAHEGGAANVACYLHQVDLEYEGRIRQRRPEEILLEP